MMKRFLMFGGLLYESRGGFEDYIRDYDTECDALDDADQWYDRFVDGPYWLQIFDRIEGVITFSVVKIENPQLPNEFIKELEENEVYQDWEQWMLDTEDIQCANREDWIKKDGKWISRRKLNEQ